MGLMRFLVKRIIALIITISLVLTVAYLLMYYSPGSFLIPPTSARGWVSCNFRIQHSIINILTNLKAAMG
ncbi:hypothetical protein [Alicyclobacillus fastidiosus]|uniref:hypothetical protein n=1 Tax=Alicyclobacillus fastidiosus TaxID=392011 RepID=UPI0023E97B08|nr:hypothetical protein [Alicyclobacillus fastidiosus]GMA60388.1 hypothetical protein GCM10025859_08280 [Alicyclobacillus fastidiosus]